MNNTLENALRETWEIKDNFYEKNKNLSLKEILIKIESKKYSTNIVKHNIKDPIVQNI
jgi:hypothetical protein